MPNLTIAPQASRQYICGILRINKASFGTFPNHNIFTDQQSPFSDRLQARSSRPPLLPYLTYQISLSSKPKNHTSDPPCPPGGPKPKSASHVGIASTNKQLAAVLAKRKLPGPSPCCLIFGTGKSSSVYSNGKSAPLTRNPGCCMGGPRQPFLRKRRQPADSLSGTGAGRVV